MFSELGHWYAIKDGDPHGRWMLNRHYSARRYKDNRTVRLFMGPGEKMPLSTYDGLAIFAWRKFIDGSGQIGVNCAIFRNEGYPHAKSSELIREAELLAWGRWPGERLYTYINPREVVSTIPGYCYLRARWKHAGLTKGGLIILEKLPKENK